MISVVGCCPQATVKHVRNVSNILNKKTIENKIVKNLLQHAVPHMQLFRMSFAQKEMISQCLSAVL